MLSPAFNDRVEKKYQLGIDPSGVADLWRDMSAFLRPYGLEAVQKITSVGSVYFDNKDCDLLRISLLGHLMLFRTRVYEPYGSAPEPIKEYWVEVKTAQGQRRRKRRFPLAKSDLLEFLAETDAPEFLLDPRRQNGGLDVSLDIYRESRETLLTMGLKPMLLVSCKRVAFQGEVERLSIDWDLRYHHVSMNVYDQNSWKDLVEPPTGKSDNVILEMKSLQAGVPDWFFELQRRFPIREREYLKPVEGMGFLFNGPLQNHKEANYFRPMISQYVANSLLG